MTFFPPSPASPGIALGLLMTACLLSVTVAYEVKPQAYSLTGDIAGSHDPSAIRAGKTWYVFTTGGAPGGGHLAIRCSDDLRDWKLCGHVFDELPAWIRQASPRTRGLWAPDISFEDGVFRLYYAYSLFGRNTSGIGLATNMTLDPKSPKYKWIDEGLVLQSASTDNFNAIDPNFVRDAHGREWLSFGSFWSGIKMRELDPRTGKPLATNSELYSLANRMDSATLAAHNGVLPPDSTAIEAPSIIRHGRYYYLFVSWDLCCRGARSTYRTMVGRSKDPFGPYVDKAGVPMMQGGGTQVLSANAKWVGPGGGTAVHTRGQPDQIFFHAYDAATGVPVLQVSTIEWVDGWPEAAVRDQ